MWNGLSVDSGVKVLEREKRSDKREYAWACKEIDAWVGSGGGMGDCEKSKHGEN